MSDDTRTVEDVQNVRDESLASAYQPHDLCQNCVEMKLAARGYQTEQYGLDDRHSDELQFSDKPDLKVLDAEDTLVAYVEVKSKRLSSDDWFGRLNRRHWDNYLYGGDTFDGAANIDVPVLLYFGVVDEENGIVVRDGFIEVQSEEQIGDGFVSYGNVVVELDESDVRNFDWFEWRVDTDE